MKPPPSKFARATPENVRALEAWLDAITACGTNTDGRPWLFYEEMDKYLGPWGESGYLIGYGRKYCELFYEDPDLTAFKSHASAYTEGGLTMVVIVSPGLVRHILEIPLSEFLPGKPNARASWSQAFETAGISVREAFDVLSLADLTNTYTSAHRRDTMAMEHMYELNDSLRAVRRLLESGWLDHVGHLEELEERLEGARWPNHDMTESASELLHEVRWRHHRVRARYDREIRMDTLNVIYRAFDPRAF